MRKPYLRLAGKLNKSERTDERSKFSTIYTEIHFKVIFIIYYNRDPLKQQFSVIMSEKEEFQNILLIEWLILLSDQKDHQSIGISQIKITMMSNKYHSFFRIENIISYIKQITPAE